MGLKGLSNAGHPSCYTFLNTYTISRGFSRNKPMTTSEQRDDINSALMDYRDGQYPSLRKRSSVAWSRCPPRNP